MYLLTVVRVNFTVLAICFIVLRTIKWTDELQLLLNKNVNLDFIDKHIREVEFRPFTKKYCYYSNNIIHRFYQQKNTYPIEGNWDNRSISFTSISSDNQLTTLASKAVVDLGFLKMGNGGTFSLTLYRYDVYGNKIDNITDWGLNQFGKFYKSKKITKEDVFHYVYAVLHYPEYRAKYELNLKRDFPRIPFYENFNQWADWGRDLMFLHINYEQAEPYQLAEVSTGNIDIPKAKLKANKEKGIIIIDENTHLEGIPENAWLYKLGTRSGLEWVLDQYKLSKPKDQTIVEKFNNYKLADHKDNVISLLKRVCTISVETMKIIDQMK